MTIRRIGLIVAKNLVPKPGITESNECDTNSDTCCLDKNVVILEYTRRTADVDAYDKSLKPTEGVPIVSGATAWFDPMKNQIYIIFINEALYYETKLDHLLINPNKVWHYGTNFWENPYEKEKELRI